MWTGFILIVWGLLAMAGIFIAIGEYWRWNCRMADKKTEEMKWQSTAR